MRERLLVLLAYGVAVSLLIVSGAGCVSCITYPGPQPALRYGMTEHEIRSHITPYCPSVQKALRDILGEPPYQPSRDGFDSIRDWVAYSIEYMCDHERWGEDYWQTPAETLLYSTGDCEDFAILLCSLLRAYGLTAEQVYVVIGVNGEDEPYGHAFLIESWYDAGDWRRIEPQTPARIGPGPRRFHLIDAELDKYEIIIAFNDLYYYAESYPWDEY